MTHMIKICLLAVVSTMLITAPLTAGPATFVVKRGLNMDIWDTWPGESQWHLKRVILPFPEWQRHIDESDLAAIKANGFDFVRIPIDPAPLLSPATEHIRGLLFQSILEAAKTVTAADLKAIIDLHLIPSADGDGFGSFEIAEQPEKFEQYLAVAKHLAEMLSDLDPDRVALELMNEPVAGCDDASSSWAGMLKRLHATARAGAPRLTLVLTGGCWSDADSLVSLDPKSIADDNVIWTFHSYAPFLLTHQGATWAGDFIRYVSNIPYPPFGDNAPEAKTGIELSRARIRNEAPVLRRNGMLSYLDEQFAEIDTAAELTEEMLRPFRRVAEWAKQYDIPSSSILLGEFGMIRQEYQSDHIMKPEWRARYMADMIALAEQHEFPWAIWGYGGAFGIVDEFSGRSAEPDVLEAIRKLH